MITQVVRAASANPPYNTYDSILELPSGSNAKQNAWLTLQLRIRLNFVDSKNPLPGKTVKQGGKWFAKDADGYLFPMLDWPAHLIARFQNEFKRVAEKTWNWQFVLITPNDYSGLDFTSWGFQVRPNVLCLFRVSLFGPTGPLDTSTAAGPLRAGPVHRTINVVNLSYATKEVRLAPGVAPTTEDPATEHIKSFDGLTWRSDADDYDDSDVFRPAMLAGIGLHNTVGHEIGHALGQSHIMGLEGDKQYQLDGINANTRAAYGEGSKDPMDKLDIMGEGDRIYLLNAVSWKERIPFHTGTPSVRWNVTGIMSTPPRAVPLGLPDWMTPAKW